MDEVVDHLAAVAKFLTVADKPVLDAVKAARLLTASFVESGDRWDDKPAAELA